MKYLAFIYSPNQLINLKEYFHINSINNYEIYYLKSINRNVNKEFFNSIKFLRLKNVKLINKTRNFFLTKLIFFFFAINLINKYRKEEKTFIIGDLLNNNNLILRLIFKNCKFILIDDGFATFWIYKKFIKKNFLIAYRDYELFYKLFYKALNVFVNLFLSKKNLELFTIYANELKLDRKYLNRLTFYKHLKKKYNFDKSIVWIIGTKYFESGILELSEEINLIKKISNFWKEKKIIYISKRTTSLKKINAIKKLDINVCTNLMPLELELIKSNNCQLPFAVCSLGSGLDKSLPMLFNGINNYLLRFKSLNNKLFFNKYNHYHVSFFKGYHGKKKILYF